MKVIIIGGGQVGAYIANLLLAKEIDVRIIEQRPKVLRRLYEEFAEKIIVEGNGSEPSVLENAGIQTTDVVVSVTGADEINLVVSTIVKFEYNIKRVISRINHPQNAWLFTQAMGVDVALNQADLLSRIITDEIDMKSLETLTKINRGQHSIIQFGVNSDATVIGHAVKELVLPQESVLIAILRGEETITVNGDTIIVANDILIAMVSDVGIKTLKSIFQ